MHTALTMGAWPGDCLDEEGVMSTKIHGRICADEESYGWRSGRTQANSAGFLRGHRSNDLRRWLIVVWI